MYPNYSYMSHINPYLFSTYYGNPYAQHTYYDYSRIYPTYPYYELDRQQTVRGQATWTSGGNVTKCGIPWSDNLYMTAAVGEGSPYKCGQTLKIRNLSVPGGREVVVTVVDTVAGYPANKINLHRRAFEALGANPALGLINIEIIPSPELEEEKWGKYLLELAQTAYPGYKVTEYDFKGEKTLAPGQIRETYEFILVSPQETIKVQGNVVYNPNTDRIISFDLKEL